MNIGLFGTKIPDNFFPYFKKLILLLKTKSTQLFIFHEIEKYLIKDDDLSTLEYQILKKHYDFPGKIDMLLSIGGDGTFLDSITYIRNSGIPILGINSGRLGFLASINKDQIEDAVNAITEKNYIIEPRHLLCLKQPLGAFHGMNYALNEITVQKDASSTMITIHTYLNGEFLNSYWADGLIISTATGSTGYSLSCSGPILAPENNSLILNPIAPHNLNVRPLVINNNCEIRLKIETRSNRFIGTLDSRSKVFSTNNELLIKKENFSINFLKLQQENFYSTLRNKLMWGLDKRN